MSMTSASFFFPSSTSEMLIYMCVYIWLSSYYQASCTYYRYKLDAIL